MSLSSGVVASSEDCVNCDKADQIGFQIQTKWHNCCYGDITLNKVEQVKTISHLINACLVEK